MISDHASEPTTAQASRPAPDHQRQKIGGWVLVTRRDDFTGAMNCELRAHRMSWEHGAIVFQFSHRSNTFAGLYRLDGAAAVSWRVNAMTLAVSGIRFNNENLANPSDGRVAIPVRALDGAGSISIQPSPGARPAIFDLRDLAAALRAARDAGCKATAGSHDP
jgi:hypothetical protein